MALREHPLLSTPHKLVSVENPPREPFKLMPKRRGRERARNPRPGK